MNIHSASAHGGADRDGLLPGDGGVHGAGAGALVLGQHRQQAPRLLAGAGDDLRPQGTHLYEGEVWLGPST